MYTNDLSEVSLFLFSPYVAVYLHVLLAWRVPITNHSIPYVCISFDLILANLFCISLLNFPCMRSLGMLIGCACHLCSWIAFGQEGNARQVSLTSRKGIDYVVPL